MKRNYIIFTILILVVAGLVLKDQKKDNNKTIETTQSALNNVEKPAFSNEEIFTDNDSKPAINAATKTPALASTCISVKTEPKKRRNQFALYKSDRFSSLLSFELPEFKIEEKEISAKTYSIIRSEGKSRPLNNKGLPALPVFKQELLIPVGSTPKLVINNNSFREIEMINPPIPGVGPVLRKQRIPEPQEGDFYSSNEIYPKSEVRMSRSFKFRGLEAITIFVSPFRYDNDKKMLRVYDDISFTVETADSEEILLSKPLTVRDFVRSAEDTFINYEEAGDEYIQTSSRSLPQPEKGKILIVTPPKFLSVIGEFVQWKKQIGFTVETHTYNNEGIDSLKATIQNKINNNTSHVILLGDKAEIPSRTYAYGHNSSNNTNYWVNDSNYDLPAPSASTNNYNAGYLIHTDQFYSGIELNYSPYLSDYIHDCYISRFPTSSSSDLRTQLHKIVCYERGEMFYDETGDWANSVLMTASKENAGGTSYKNRRDFQHLQAQKDLLNGASTFANFYEVYDGTSATQSQNTTSIINSINQGTSVAYYLGHGGYYGWYTNQFRSFYFDIDDLARLTTTLPVLSIQPVCQTGCFYHNSFAERQMSNAAFCGVLASTNDTYWNPPMVQIEEFTQNLVEDEYTTVGGLIFDSIQQATSWANANSHQIVRDSTPAQLHYFGDCSMAFRTKSPQILELEILNEIKLNEPISIKVTTTGGQVAAGVDVSLMSKNSISSKETDADGIVNFGTLDQDGMYTITAFKRNSIVAQDVFSVGRTLIIKNSSFSANQEVANLKALIDGTDFSVNSSNFFIENGVLKTANSFILSNDQEVSISYIASSDTRSESRQTLTLSLTPSYNQSYQFKISQGWNLLGSPISTQLSAENVLKDAGGTSLINSKLFYWPNGATDYEPTETSAGITEQLGFWVYSNKNSSSAEFSGLQTRGVMTHLNIGWNLYSPALQHSIPEGAECVWGWDNKTQKYHQLSEENLKPTLGYWIFMMK